MCLHFEYQKKLVFGLKTFSLDVPKTVYFIRGQLQKRETLKKTNVKVKHVSALRVPKHRGKFVCLK